MHKSIAKFLSIPPWISIWIPFQVPWDLIHINGKVPFPFSSLINLAKWGKPPIFSLARIGEKSLLLLSLNSSQISSLNPSQIPLNSSPNSLSQKGKTHFLFPLFIQPNRLKTVLLKTKEVWISKISVQLPYLVFKKEISKPKTLSKKNPFWKNYFLKSGIQKKILPLTSSPSKLLAYFKCFENLAPISKCYLKSCFKPFVSAHKELN